MPLKDVQQVWPISAKLWQRACEDFSVTAKVIIKLIGSQVWGGSGIVRRIGY